MATLREMKDEGWSITLYCLSASGPFCYHSWKPTLDQMIQFFGPDFDLTGDRKLFGRLVCEACGGRGASVIVHAPDVPHRSSGGHRTSAPGMTIAEATRRYHEAQAERRRLGIKSIAELNAESRATLQAVKRAERKGETLIGPPNPRAIRKRDRSS